MGGDDQVGTAGDAALLLAKAAVVALERRIEAGYKLTQVGLSESGGDGSTAQQARCA